MITTPTTREISENIIANLQASLSQTVPLLPKSFIRVLAKTLAGLYVILYKYTGWVKLQQNPATADFRDTTINGRLVNPLIDLGNLIGVGNPTAATAAQLLIEISVTSLGGTLPSGTQLSNTATGVIYITSGSISLDASTKQVNVIAVNDQTDTRGLGSQGNMDPGDTLQFVNPLGNVNRNATVVSQVVTAADAESEAVYRQRVIDRFQKRPQGGAYADYEAWSEEVEGIINAYPYTGDPGEVNVYVEATPESSGDPDGIPTAAQLTAVEDSINQADRRPANAFVNVLPIYRTEFDVVIQGLVVDEEATVKTNIEAALEEYFVSREPYIEGLSVPPRKDRITVAGIYGVIDDIVQLYGGIFESVTLQQSGIDVGFWAFSEGEKSKLDAVSYT